MGASGSAIAGLSTVIDLTAGFNAKFGTSYTGTQLRTTYLKEFLAYFVSEFKIISNMMTKRSTMFHAAPALTLADGTHYVLRHTPKADQRFMMYTPLWEQAKAMVLPEIFNTEYLQPCNEMNPNKSGKKSDYVGTISGFLLSDPRLSGKKSDCIGTISGF